MTSADILYAFIFFLPAGVSNMTPIFVSKLPYLRNFKQPLDFGKQYKGKPIFGKNKTWRGLISGTIAGTLTALVIYQFSDNFRPLYILAGTLMSFGALFGDAAESFFKRQKGVPAGKSWFPFDQTDYIIGGLIFSAPLGKLTWELAGLIAVLYFGLHLLSSYIGFLLRLKDSPI